MKWKQIAVLSLAGITMLALQGCGRRKEEASVSNAGAVRREEEKKSFVFRDVLGEEYEVPLLEKVPKHLFEFSRLVEKDGYKYYTNKEGKVISRLGIDVSEFQPSIDWQQVKNSGVEFAIIRLGYRGYGEKGTLVEDSMFRQHMEGAFGAGLDVGVYFFSQALNEKEAREEAEFVLERVRDYKLACPVVFDTEEIKFDTSRTDSLAKEQFTKNCAAFLNRVGKAGYDTMIYANMKWMAFTLELDKLTEYKKWYADYEKVPQCPYEFSMWQYTETGSVPGIEGNVDLNVWFGNEKIMQKENAYGAD